MHDSPVLQAIFKRRSIREYKADPVDLDDLFTLIQAGIWAPSGLNNQPWRFVIIQDEETRAQLAELTHYRHIVLAAPALIAVYLARADMYDEVKDHQAAGACIQNMLLATEALGLGAVWLGQILKNKPAVNQVLGLDDGLDLMALLAIGHPAHHRQKSTRKPLDHFILKTT
ncbi:MAG: nitroreductase family protein [Deltaproteobacteria bacterium]